MGASSAEIDQEIKEARGELDETLGVLERRAARSARVYGRVAAGVLVGAAVVVVGVIVYRRRHQKNVVKRLHHVLFESVRDLPEEMRSKLKKRLPIKVVITDKDDERDGGSAWSGIVAKMAPTLIGSATGAVMARFRAAPDRVVAAE